MSASRVWLITGASRGIGLALVKRVLAEGERVAMLARGPQVETLAAEFGDACIGLRADVSDRDSVTRALQTLDDHWGKPQVVVNNAGLHRGGRLKRLDPDDWQAVLDTNLTGTMNIIRTVDPMLDAGACVINVGAVVGFRGFPGDAAYAASKAGIAGLTRALSIEYAPRSVRVNLVIPGLVLTEMTGALSEKALESMRDIIPMARFGEPEEIADAIWMVSSASYMTGAFVPVDGGLMSSFGVAN